MKNKTRAMTLNEWNEFQQDFYNSHRAYFERLSEKDYKWFENWINSSTEGRSKDREERKAIARSLIRRCRHIQ